MSMFEQATRLKLRFKITQGLITVEDLWDLPLVSLDTLAKALNRELKEVAEESFIAEESTSSKKLNLAFEIVKHVITVKLEDREVAKEQIVKSQRKATIQRILAAKEDETLQGMSAEDLRKELESL